MSTLSHSKYASNEKRDIEGLSLKKLMTGELSNSHQVETTNRCALENLDDNVNNIRGNIKPSAKES
jgi:hypothetical protein